ncbi:Hypothetical_protein [Hexamita inflata]|uniref:Hypothetical_protein n=1 Tax=Hexamita inflata TaxID=28002 RepID=A0AA86PWD8_9EUKA|nr:Hypothetical protein HINF_LOCUS33716 [Hexamita inflata]
MNDEQVDMRQDQLSNNTIESSNSCVCCTQWHTATTRERSVHHQSINRTAASRWSAGLARRSAELRLRQRRLATLDVQGLPPLRRSIPQRGPSTSSSRETGREMEWETWSVVTKSSQNMLNESIYFCILFIVTGLAGHLNYKTLNMMYRVISYNTRFTLYLDAFI